MTSTVLSIVKKVNMQLGYNSFNLRNAGVNIIKSPTPPPLSISGSVKILSQIHFIRQ